MSSSSDDNEASPDNHDVANNRQLDNLIARDAANGTDSSDAESFSRTRSPDLFESGTITPLPDLNGSSFRGYGEVKTADEQSDTVDSPDLPPLNEEIGSDQVASPGEGSEHTELETPDDTPSLKVLIGIIGRRLALKLYRNLYSPLPAAVELLRVSLWLIGIARALYNPSRDDSLQGLHHPHSSRLVTHRLRFSIRVNPL